MSEGRGRLRKFLRDCAGWVALALVLIGVVWVVVDSESFQACINGEDSNYQDAQFYKRVAFFRASTGDDLETCISVFLEANEHAITAFSVLLTAIFTGALTWSTYWLWRATKRLAEGADDQAEKMLAAIDATRAVSDRTKEVADAMGKSASAMGKVAYQTERVAIESREIADRQFKQMKEHIAAARSANDIAHQSMVSSQRAWLSIEDFRLVHPTRFTEDGAQIGATVTVKSLGATPASGVFLDVVSFYPGVEKFADVQAKFRNALLNRPGPVGNILFPSQPMKQTLFYGDGSERVGMAFKDSHGIPLRAQVMFLVGTGYRITGDPEPHLTYFIFGAQVQSGFCINDGAHFIVPRGPFLDGEAT